MSILIKEYNVHVELQLKKLLSLCKDEEDLISIVKSPACKFTYIACIESELVGVVVGWESTFHPHCMYFRIISHPLYEKDGVNETLLKKIESLKSVVKPLQTSIWHHTEKLNDLYEAAGFELIRKTYLPTLVVSSVEINKYTLRENDFELQTLAEIREDEVLIKQLAKLVRSNYEAAHRVNPVVAASLDKWKKLIFTDDTIVEGSYLYVDQVKKEIIAYSFLHESDDQDTYELDWCGCANDALKKWLPQLVEQQVTYARQKGVQTINAEFDTTDDYAMEVLKSFPFSFDSTWMTYRK